MGYDATMHRRVFRFQVDGTKRQNPCTAQHGSRCLSVKMSQALAQALGNLNALTRLLLAWSSRSSWCMGWCFAGWRSWIVPESGTLVRPLPRSTNPNVMRPLDMKL